MVSACICCHGTCDVEDITVLCKGNGECLCCAGESCCAAGEESKGFGCIEKKEGDICRCACPCCVEALVTPKLCCASGGSCLCCWNAASFPFSEDYVNEFVCAVYCLQCAPQFGCCKPPPYSKALDKPKGGGGAPPTTVEIER
jgi:hypothetical protein